MNKTAAVVLMTAMVMLGAACSKSTDKGTSTTTADTTASSTTEAVSSDTTERDGSQATDTSVKSTSVNCPTQQEVDEVDAVLSNVTMSESYDKAKIEDFKKGLRMMLDVYERRASQDLPDDVAIIKEHWTRYLETLDSIDFPESGELSEELNNKLLKAFEDDLANEDVTKAADNIMKYWSACENVDFGEGADS